MIVVALKADRLRLDEGGLDVSPSEPLDGAEQVLCAGVQVVSNV